MQLCADLPIKWRVFFLAMLPVGELRAALPLGVYWGLSMLSAFFCSLAGNFVPVIPLLLGLRRLLQWRVFSVFTAAVDSYVQRKSDKVKRYGVLGLFLLVAVPFPGTGIWTGCLVASVLGLPFRSSLIAVTAGEVTAGILVALMTMGISSLFFLMKDYCFLILITILLLFFLINRKIF